MLPRMFIAHFKRLLFVTFIAGLIAAAPSAFAADPQPYTVTIAPSGIGSLDATLKDSSLLLSLRERAPVPPFGLIDRARRDLDRMTEALHSFGYYGASLAVTIANHALDDPALLPTLEETPAGMAVAVNVALDKGQLYTLRTIAIEGNVPAEVRTALMLASGQPAIGADVAAAQARMLNALREAGYAFATVSDPIAYADDAAHALDVTFHVDPGAKVMIGAITFEGLSDVNEGFVSATLTIHTGDQFRPSTIATARQGLVATGAFLSVNVVAADHPDENNRIALTFTFQERPAHAVNLAGTYSTDLGVSFSAGWSHRNLLGNAEQLNLSAAATGLGGNATDGLGYRLTAQFIKPLFLQRDQALQFDVSAVKQDLIAYQQQAESMGATLRRKLSPTWTVSAGVTLIQDDVSQEGVDRIYQLLLFPMTAAYDTTGITNPLQDALHGMRASLVVTPSESFGARTNTFFVLQTLASTYFDLSGGGRSVLALRGQAGAVLGASNFELPPDQRLYAGGSATVRGFRYQSIGPLFPNGDPIGGTAVDAATIELRQRLFGNFGAAAFIDAGQTTARGVPFTGPISVGAGAGARYYTAIGAIRLDVAFPLTRVPNGDSFEVYIGLGQAF